MIKTFMLTILFASLFAMTSLLPDIQNSNTVSFHPLMALANGPETTSSAGEATDAATAEDDEDDEFKGKSCKQRLKGKKKKFKKLKCETRSVSVACPVLKVAISKLEKKCGDKKKTK